MWAITPNNASMEAIGTPPPYGELKTSGLNIVSRSAALPCSATHTARLR